MTDIEKKIFPEKEDPKMTDDEWIRYCIDVWCCNSLNERVGVNRSLANSGSRFVANKCLAFNAIMFERAQSVINYLLQENIKLREELEDAECEVFFR